MLYIICYVSSTYNIRLLFQVQYLFYSTRYPLKPHMPSSQELNLTRKGYIKVEESAICLVCKNHLISTILPILIVLISACITFITNMQRFTANDLFLIGFSELCERGNDIDDYCYNCFSIHPSNHNPTISLFQVNLEIMNKKSNICFNFKSII